MSDLANRVVPVVLGVLLIVAGGYLYVSERQATANAEPVDATVLSTEVYDAEPGDAPNDRTDDDYRASVEYQYAYDGQTYTSETLCPGAGQGCAPKGKTPRKAEKFLEGYPEGETVTAYVRSDDPSKSYLVAGGSSVEYLGLAGVGVVVTVLAGRRLLAE